MKKLAGIVWLFKFRQLRGWHTSAQHSGVLGVVKDDHGGNDFLTETYSFTSQTGRGYQDAKGPPPSSLEASPCNHPRARDTSRASFLCVPSSIAIYMLPRKSEIRCHPNPSLARAARSLADHDTTSPTTLVQVVRVGGVKWAHRYEHAGVLVTRLLWRPLPPL